MYSMCSLFVQCMPPVTAHNQGVYITGRIVSESFLPRWPMANYYKKSAHLESQMDNS